MFLIVPAGTPIKAAKSWAEFRFQDIDAGREIEGSFSNLQRNSAFRIALFFLGVLPQLIKLCAMQGLPWVQFVGGAYLASFITIELLTFLASLDAATHEPRAPRRHTDMEGVLGSSTVTCSVMFAISLAILGLTTALAPHFEEHPLYHFPHLYNASVIINLCVLGVTLVLHVRSRRKFALFLILTSAFLCMPVARGQWGL